MVSISPSAIKEIKRIQSQRNKAQSSSTVKLSVKQGGCSGLFYELVLENIISGDGEYHLLEIDGIDFWIKAESLGYVKDLKLDYSEDLMGGGFRFHNPQAIDVCGCGISFRGSRSQE